MHHTFSAIFTLSHETFSRRNKNILDGVMHTYSFLVVFVLMIFIVCGYFSKINFVRFFLDSDQVENFIGSDLCPNCLQGYKQRTLPNESAINVSIKVEMYDWYRALFKLIHHIPKPVSGEPTEHIVYTRHIFREMNIFITGTYALLYTSCNEKNCALL